MESSEFDEDLAFAAESTVKRRANLRSARQGDAGMVRELARRLLATDAHLRSFQDDKIATVASKVAVGLMAVLIILFRWPHIHLPLAFISGFQPIGRFETSGVMPSVTPAFCPSKEELLHGASSTLADLPARPQKENEFLWDDAEAGIQRGWTSARLTKEDLDKLFGIERWAPCPNFCVIGSKKRQIVDALRGKHNLHSAQDEAIVLCTPLQPGACAKLLHREMSKLGQKTFEEGHVLESGTEDMPDAYKFCPIQAGDRNTNISAVQHPTSLKWYFIVHYVLIFGYVNSVYAFGCLSRFLDAISVRLLQVMWCMFYDDGSLQDLKCARGSGQAAVKELVELLGFGFKESKSQPMSSESTFLGLSHEVSHALDAEGFVEFKPREGLVEKAAASIEERLTAGTTTPAQASKLCGLVKFLALGLYNGVALAALGPLQQRQYFDSEPWANSSVHYIIFAVPQAGHGKHPSSAVQLQDQFRKHHHRGNGCASGSR